MLHINHVLFIKMHYAFTIFPQIWVPSRVRYIKVSQETNKYSFSSILLAREIKKKKQKCKEK